MTEKDHVIKFPRTRHIFDAGGSGVGRDDLVMEKREKIDGANLGVSRTEDYQLRFQNRSHFVTSESATQWRQVQSWAEQTPGLWTVLESPDIILFGEWMYAQHSVPYDRLPSYFIAFDIFNAKEGRFYSRAERLRRLEGTGIYSIPLVREGVTNRDQFTALLETQSHFRSQGPLEGVYARIEGPVYLEDRAKVVRPDFIQNIEKHWSSQSVTKNVIVYDWE